MEDINDIIDSLILKYHVDRHNPLFKKKFEAVAEIKNWIQPYLNDSECLVASSEQTDIDMFLWDLNMRVPWNVLVVDSDLERHDLLKRDGRRTVLFVSYHWRREIEWRLKQIKPQWNILSLYDYLESCGLYFEGNYYDIFRTGYYDTRTAAKSLDYKDIDYNAICYYDKKSYEYTNVWYKKMRYLEKLIFDYVFIRDFVNLEISILEYCYLRGKHSDEYKGFLNSIQIAITRIKGELSKRKKKDVIMVWLDQLEYADEKKMPFLHSVTEKGLVFTNAYTPTPFTHSTEKALFCGKLVVDDKAYKIKEINKDNSPLLKMLDEHGYEYVCLSRCICQGSQYRMMVNIYTPISMMWWEAIRWILMSENPGFLLIHELAHTHTPCVSPAVSGNSYSYQYEWELLSEKEQIQQNVIQREESSFYADQQLGYYTSLLPDSLYKIYMSDHGSDLFTRYHIILKICQKDIAPAVEERMMSLVDFKGLMQHILKWDGPVKSLDDITSRSVIIQDIDHYNADDIKRCISNRKMPFLLLFGYHGIITRSCIYMKFNNGWEEYKYIDDAPLFNIFDDIKELRQKTNIVTTDLEEDKFKYSRCIYQVWDRYSARTAGLKAAIYKEIKHLFFDIPSSACVGIRGGGEHTSRLLFAIDTEQRRKIKYIFDKDPRCKSAHMGIEVCPPEELADIGVNIVVVSSYKNRQQWSKEIRNMNSTIQIIDIYEYLLKKGIVLTQEFYNPVFKKEDFEVEISL